MSSKRKGKSSSNMKTAALISMVNGIKSKIKQSKKAKNNCKNLDKTVHDLIKIRNNILSDIQEDIPLSLKNSHKNALEKHHNGEILLKYYTGLIKKHQKTQKELEKKLKHNVVFQTINQFNSNLSVSDKIYIKQRIGWYKNMNGTKKDKIMFKHNDNIYEFYIKDIQVYWYCVNKINDIIQEIPILNRKLNLCNEICETSKINI